mgnify:FL=1
MAYDIVHMNDAHCQSVTISAVAQNAGVSRMTVSRVMSNDPRVLPQTRQRVLAAMQEMGYVPNPSARAMRSRDKLLAGQNSCFAVIFGTDTQNADEFFCEVARGVESQAAASGLCALQVHWLEDAHASWLRVQSACSVAGMCGVILVGQFGREDIESISRVTPNVILVDCPRPAGTSCVGIESDNVAGCELALRQLAEAGSRRPVVIAGPQGHYFSNAMQSAAGNLAGLFESVQLLHSDYSSKSGRQIVSDLIARGADFDGIFANDTLCLGAYRAIHSAGLGIPKDIRIVGFDDLPICEFLTPSLTSVSIDKRQLGREAVASLLQIVRGRCEQLNMKITVNATLIRRESA